MDRSESSDEEPALLIQEIWADTLESDFLKAFLEHPSLKVLKKLNCHGVRGINLPVNS